MNTPSPETLIRGSEKLTSIFGCWPSFHDAEITELHLERGEISEQKNIWEFPTLTVKIILWALTSRVNEKGFLDFEHPTLASLQFRDVEGFSTSGFNHQNAIYGLEITPKQNGDLWNFDVHFNPAFGMGSRFKCGEILVLNAIPWDREKRPPGWLSIEQLTKLGPLS